MVSSFGRDYSDNTIDDYSFGVGEGGDKGGVGPRITNLTYKKVDCCIYGGDFVSSKSIDYSSRIHLYKDRSYYSSYLSRDNNHVAAGDVGGGVDNRTTHLSFHKVPSYLIGEGQFRNHSGSNNKN